MRAAEGAWPPARQSPQLYWLPARVTGEPRPVAMAARLREAGAIKAEGAAGAAGWVPGRGPRRPTEPGLLGGEQGLTAGVVPALRHRSGSFGTVPEKEPRKENNLMFDKSTQEPSTQQSVCPSVIKISLFLGVFCR